jgi:hypothetical protein
VLERQHVKHQLLRHGRASLGLAEHSIRTTTDGTAKNLRDWLGPVEYSATVDELRKAGKPMDAAVALFGAYTYLLVAFAWTAATETALKDGLALASGKPWRQAAALLLDRGRALVTWRNRRSSPIARRPSDSEHGGSSWVTK